jgi:hypothetical protein
LPPVALRGRRADVCFAAFVKPALRCSITLSNTHLTDGFHRSKGWVSKDVRCTWETGKRLGWSPRCQRFHPTQPLMCPLKVGRDGMHKPAAHGGWQFGCTAQSQIRQSNQRLGSTFRPWLAPRCGKPPRHQLWPRFVGAFFSRLHDRTPDPIPPGIAAGFETAGRALRLLGNHGAMGHLRSRLVRIPPTG